MCYTRNVGIGLHCWTSPVQRLHVKAQIEAPKLVSRIAFLLALSDEMQSQTRKYQVCEFTISNWFAI